MALLASNQCTARGAPRESTKAKIRRLPEDAPVKAEAAR
jgi:hypothetical protein